MVAQQLAAAYRAFCTKMVEANLPLSRNKTKALATSSKLRDALKCQPGWDIVEGDFVDVHRDLGGDAVSGSYRRGWKRDLLTIVTKTALMACVEMVWASLPPEAAARSRLATGLCIASRLHPWRLVKEPISALVLTLERVGWGFINGDPYRLHDALGHEYQVRRYSPAFFGHVVFLDCRRAIGLEEVKRHGSSMWGWEVPPFWQPVLDLASHRSEVWDLHHQRALRCLIQRFRCQAHDGWRREFPGPPLWEAAARAELMGRPFTELFARGLFPDISELVQRPLRTDDDFKRATSGPNLGPCADGEHVFADGSGLDQNCPSLRAAGWSIIVFDKHRKLVAEASERPKGAEVIKVRAHLGPQAVREGLITQFELDDNALADARAKEGAPAVGADSSDVHCIGGCQFIARLAARYAAAQEVRIAGSGLRDSMGVEALEIVDLCEWPADPAE
ncbi:unnamed protein product, partial [Prorocentrum cordatum]